MVSRSRLVGLLAFVALVAAIQIAQNTYHWYAHREERVHLAELREEVIDAGAEMIRAHLELKRIREEIAMVDRELRRRGRPAGPWSPAARRPGPNPARTADDARILERNRRLHDLNEAVIRHNSAAAQYRLLADSIRGLAVRAGEPYFAVPLPGEAASARGVVPPERRPDRDDPDQVARFGLTAGVAAQPGWEE